MLATQQEVSDGTLHVINVGIPFFEQDDLAVSLDQGEALEVGVGYVWSNGTTIEFLPTTDTPGGLVPAGVTVLVRRTTKDDAMYNIYDGGAPFSRTTLDENFKQLLFRSQEFSEGLGIDGLQNNLSMNGYRITELGSAQEDTDALPKGQADTLYVNVSGDSMTGPLSMGGNKVSAVGTPSAGTDAIRIIERDALALSMQEADASLQAQITGMTPPMASPFSPVSWHPQVIANSIVIPDNMNAWSFGPTMTIAEGQSVTIGEGSFWTIAEGASTQEGPLVAELPTDIDMGVLP